MTGSQVRSSEAGPVLVGSSDGDVLTWDAALRKWVARAPSGGGVTTVFGRAGAVLALLGDYTSDLVTNLSTNPGATVTEALDDIDAALFALETFVAGLTTDDVGNASGVGGASASAALNTLAASIAGLVTGVGSVFGRSGAVVAANGDYTSSQVTNASLTVPGATTTAALESLNTKEILIGVWQMGNNPANTAARYLLTNTGGPATVTGQQQGQIVLDRPGVVTRVRFRQAIALAVDTLAYTLQIANADTAVTATAAAGALLDSDVAGGGVTWAAGDAIGIKLVQSGTAGAGNRATNVSVYGYYT